VTASSLYGIGTKSVEVPLAPALAIAHRFGELEKNKLFKSLNKKREKGDKKMLDNVWQMSTTSLKNYYRSYSGNGYLGIQVSEDGTGAKSEPPVKSFIAGVYEGKEEKLVEIPRWSEVKFYNGENYLQFEEEKISNFSQTLNMKGTFFNTEYSWNKIGRITDFKITFFVSRNDPHLAVIKYSFVPHYKGKIVIENNLDASPFSNLILSNKGLNSHQIWLETTLPYSKIKIAQSIYTSLTPNLTNIKENSFMEEKRVHQQLEFPVEDSKEYTLYKYVSFYTSRDTHSPLEKAKNKDNEAHQKGWTGLFSEHKEEWSNLWKSDILVDDKVLQRRIHTNLYYLLSSIREDLNYSIPPCGLSNDGWGGHIFWDADTFMFPALLLLHPKLAKIMVMYRYNTLDSARKNAKNAGYRGAAYGWQTALSGLEVGGGGKILSDEIHITGDVALAQWQYYLATKDEEYLRKYASKVIIETAKFWESRVTYNEKFNHYEIKGVIPPDESVCEKWGIKTVDNSIFTNALARWNLYKAIEISKKLRMNYPQKWKEIADKMYLPFDKEKGIHLEYEGYNGHPIKVVDALLIYYPLEIPMDKEIILKNLEYYYRREKEDNLRIAHSPGIYSVLYSQLDKGKEAYKHFKEYDKFYLPPFEVMRETLSLPNYVTVFLTGMGSFLQALIYGFAGIKLTSEGFLIRPTLPNEIPRLTLKGIHYAGEVYDLKIEEKGKKITVNKLSGDHPEIFLGKTEDGKK